VISGGNNLDSDGSCSFAAAGDQNGVDPQLGPLADNGGPTMTHLPAAAAPSSTTARQPAAPPPTSAGSPAPG